MPVSSFNVAFTVDVIIGGLCMAFFLVMRRKLPRNYSPRRCIYPDTAPAPPTGFVAWIAGVWNMSDETLYQTAGAHARLSRLPC